MKKTEAIAELTRAADLCPTTPLADACRMAVDALSGVAPTVDAVPVVHGWWKRHYCDDGLSDGWQCSVCGEWYYFGENKPNFCPNCGTKMDGKDGDHEEAD